jgi:hypothetical protein
MKVITRESIIADKKADPEISLGMLATKYKVSRATIHGVLNTAGIITSRENIQDKILACFQNGDITVRQPLKELAERFNTTEATVCRAREKFLGKPAKVEIPAHILKNHQCNECNGSEDCNSKYCRTFEDVGQAYVNFEYDDVEVEIEFEHIYQCPDGKIRETATYFTAVSFYKTIFLACEPKDKQKLFEYLTAELNKFKPGA